MRSRDERERREAPGEDRRRGGPPRRARCADPGERHRRQPERAAADRADLERNRLAIVRAQWDLSRALIARYRPSFQAA